MRSARRRASRSRRRTARGWLYVADSSQDRLVAADHPADRAEPRAGAGRPPPAARRVGG